MKNLSSLVLLIIALRSGFLFANTDRPVSLTNQSNTKSLHIEKDQIVQYNYFGRIYLATVEYTINSSGTEGQMAHIKSHPLNDYDFPPSTVPIEKLTLPVTQVENRLFYQSQKICLGNKEEYKILHLFQDGTVVLIPPLHDLSKRNSFFGFMRNLIIKPKKSTTMNLIDCGKMRPIKEPTKTQDTATIGIRG